MLTADQASLLSGDERVVSMFVDPEVELHTTRSWDFLNLKLNTSIQHQPHSTTDVIVGVIDTGIWPESPSFSDYGFGNIPSRWKGVCMEASDFNNSNCNRKLIGARFYSSEDTKSATNKQKESPRDYVGHGTHTASIATGNIVNSASYYGLVSGVARGGLPSARVAIYKACTQNGCQGSTILKAIDDAIDDGVDIISISIGVNSILQGDFLNDPIAIGALHAAEKGVMVVASAGNKGPMPYTAVNTAPWIFTVAASSIDRDFESTVILGNNKSFKGTAINFSPLEGKKTYPLATGASVAAATSVPEARFCTLGSLDSKKVAGKIIVCLGGGTSRNMQILYVEDAKAKGLILISEVKRSSPLDSGSFPFTEIGNVSGSQILSYINSTRNPSATILATTQINKFKPAPVVAYFSSRGPGIFKENILKPDITAPGVSILAAIVPKDEMGSPPPHGEKLAIFGMRSGTSMSCPHVTGAAAFIKAVHQDWTPSMIKSALMTTATVSNNLGKPLTNTTFDYSIPHEIGTGDINPIKALDPGLVFETTTQDYQKFLCHFGYKGKAIRSTTNTTSSCPRNLSKELISDINYPSISIGKLDKNSPKIVKRVATNVGLPNATYVSSVHAPRGILVKVQPEELIFNQGKIRATFQVSFDGKYASKGYHFGAITWSHGFHRARVTFAANVM